MWVTFPLYNVDLIFYARCGVPTLSDGSVLYTRALGLKIETTLQTSNERINTLELQVASKNVEIEARVADLSSLGALVTITKKKRC